MNPPRRLLVPPWDLAIVLAALREFPYEPLENASLQHLTLKALFLLAVTSVRRVSELQALCALPPYALVNPRSVTLRINPAFVPKTTTSQAMEAPIVLHCFPRVVRTAFDQDLRDNCPVRAITLYLDRTKEMRQDNQLFVGFGPNRRGKAVMKQTLAPLHHGRSWQGWACRQFVRPLRGPALCRLPATIA